ncbi:MAG: hypothetical protein LDL11_03760, partial [Desulfarculus sp.]|nr:hypothetical protein [Desulfarculus sp.]
PRGERRAAEPPVSEPASIPDARPGEAGSVAPIAPEAGQTSAKKRRRRPRRRRPAETPGASPAPTPDEGA